MKNVCICVWSLSGPYFPAFGINTERFSANAGNENQKNSEFGHFLLSEVAPKKIKKVSGMLWCKFFKKFRNTRQDTDSFVVFVI